MTGKTWPLLKAKKVSIKNKGNAESCGKGTFETNKRTFFSFGEEEGCQL